MQNNKITLKIIPEACGIEHQYSKEFNQADIMSYIVIRRTQGFKLLPSRVIFKVRSGAIYKTQMESDQFSKLFPTAIGHQT